MNEERVTRDIIVIGASAGAFETLRYLCSRLPADLPAVVGIVLHRSPWYHSDMSALYETRTGIRVREAKAHDRLDRGTVYFAPADYHMLFEDPHIELWRGPKLHFTRPAADCLFFSAATAYGKRVAGVLLSGGGSDGAQGFVKITEGGGLTLVQRPEEASFPMMPLSGIREDSPAASVPLRALPDILVALAKGEAINIEHPGVDYQLWGSR